MAETNPVETTPAVVPPLPEISSSSDPRPHLPADIIWPPTQDELPYDDGVPMETYRHHLQMTLLIESLNLHWGVPRQHFAGGNMFVYFSLAQVKNQDFRGPDFFAVLDVIPHRERKSWVVWEEGKGPDVVIELLSDSTAEFDKDEKKLIYQDKLRVPEYYWYDPSSGEWAGFVLRDRVYHPLTPDAQGRFISPALGLALVQREGEYQMYGGSWLRWATLDGHLLLSGEELAAQAQAEAAQSRERAERLAAKLRELGIDPDNLAG